jgi:Domain of unknown function (DUF4424)
MLKSALFAAALLSVAAASARANDSTAELATGGLIFVQNDDVEMRAEDLLISAQEVSVKYRFFNKAAKDVTVLVAFPMPEVRISEQDQNISLPTEDPVNILAFKTSANGQPVTTKVEQRVFAVGIERTQYLHDLGIPLAPHVRATGEALDKLSPEKWDELIRLGLAEVEEYDIGKGMQKHLAPRWGLKTTFYWEQTFPAQQETLIEHQYKPSVGGSAQTDLGAPYAVNDAWYGDYQRKYCIDKDFYSTIERLRKANKSEFGPPYSEERIDYILKTGANWSGPIKDFRLVVDKGNTDSQLSFCGDGIKKIGATQFELRKADYTPDGNLSVLILKKIAKE